MNFINKWKDMWQSKGCSLILGSCLAFFILVGIYQIITGKSGTWSSNYQYDPIHDKYLESKYSSNNPSGSGKSSKGETECRRVLEGIFRKPFPNVRPSFLNNEVTNFNLELDCYNKDLSLALEYNGVQHYKYNKFFHSSKEAFRNQQYRDYMKKDLCKKYGIRLIEVPYTIKEKDIELFIRKKLISFGYQL